jgi:hypothetical protein
VTKRFLSNRPIGLADAGFGPSLGLMAHVALFPLVRVGAYASAELSPASDAPVRRFFTFGVRAKILSPWPQSPLRAWFFAGIGYVGVYAPHFQRRLFVQPAPEIPGEATDVRIEGASGGFAEIPVGVGASYKITKRWEFFAEIFTRFGVGFGGKNYAGRIASPPVDFKATLPPFGNDALSLGLSVGIAAGM